MNAKFIGMDSWDRPVYECEDETLIKDIDSRADRPPALYTSVNNAFDGEPDMPVKKDITLLPQRIIW
ncbi:hypothetical protein [Ructibacterium gallinarum]|uniref:Uncharacterized protein n=1 Tax=Ructibacterium gallinarum TaxID=2779355 RepID=A0A9D5M1G5_9FIRM|nr:hypothetical protein [Ructibacterium gallinarum]MBE5040545.1 hypothetical protein [Ructibacterium gallinarum]